MTLGLTGCGGGGSGGDDTPTSDTNDQQSDTENPQEESSIINSFEKPVAVTGVFRATDRLGIPIEGIAYDDKLYTWATQIDVDNDDDFSMTITDIATGQTTFYDNENLFYEYTNVFLREDGNTITTSLTDETNYELESLHYTITLNEDIGNTKVDFNDNMDDYQYLYTLYGGTARKDTALWPTYYASITFNTASTLQGQAITYEGDPEPFACDINGTFTIPTTTEAIFDLSVTIDGCDALSGNYEGLGYSSGDNLTLVISTGDTALYWRLGRSTE